MSNLDSGASQQTDEAASMPDTDKGNSGIVYVLENPAMPGYVKIGMTDNLDQRMRQLFNSSAVPVPFTCYHAGRVNNPAYVEKSLHEIFGDKRAHPRREFFEVDNPNRVATAIRLVQLEDVTPNGEVDANAEREDTEAVRRATLRAERKENFSFAMVGIEVGEELHFVDDTTMCKVASLKPPRVEIGGEEMSLSAAATKIKQSRYQIQGSLYWKYQGETLQAMRERIEEETD